MLVQFYLVNALGMHNSLKLYYERGNAILEIISYPLVNLKVKYVTSLIQNINKRFSKCQDIFSAFKVFHSGLIPRYVLSVSTMK